MRMFNKAVLALALSVGLITSAFAGDYSYTQSGAAGGAVAGGFGGQVTTWNGDFTAHTGVDNTGGSEAVSGVNGNGYSFQHSATNGGGTAYAGGSFTSNGVANYAGTTSHATSTSFGVQVGNAGTFDNLADAGVGTNVKANSYGDFSSETHGINVTFGGGIVFSGFQTGSVGGFGGFGGL